MRRQKLSTTTRKAHAHAAHAARTEKAARNESSCDRALRLRHDRDAPGRTGTQQNAPRHRRTVDLQRSVYGMQCPKFAYSRAINRASVRMPSAIRSDHGVPAEIRMKFAKRWRAENSGPGAMTIRRRSA